MKSWPQAGPDDHVSWSSEVANATATQLACGAIENKAIVICATQRDWLLVFKINEAVSVWSKMYLKICVYVEFSLKTPLKALLNRECLPQQLKKKSKTFFFSKSSVVDLPLCLTNAFTHCLLFSVFGFFFFCCLLPLNADWNS